MKKFRQFAGFMMAAAMTLSMAACGGGNAAQTTAAPETAAPETTAETTAADAKIKVGISWSKDDYDVEKSNYCNAVIKAGGEPVYLDQFTSQEDAAEALKGVDALVMTGGEDIDPSYYHEEKAELLEETNEVRDVSDFALLNAAIAADIPTLTTCRGTQFLNVVCGGTLYQDFPSVVKSDVVHRDPNHENWVYHEIKVDGGNILADALGGEGTYEVNSWHHQALKDLGDKLQVVAKASDGIIEGVVKTDNTYFMGVQFHPEALIIEDGKDAYLPIYTNLIKAAEKKKNP